MVTHLPVSLLSQISPAASLASIQSSRSIADTSDVFRRLAHGVGAICVDRQPEVRHASFEHESLSPRLLTGNAATADRSYRRMYSILNSHPRRFAIFMLFFVCISVSRPCGARHHDPASPGLFNLTFSAVTRTSKNFRIII